MGRAATAVRILLGLVFLVFGFDGLLHFFPLPPMPEPAAAFIGTLTHMRLFYAVKVIEIAAALLLLSGRFVPLALSLLAPIIFNILWFDAALDPHSLGVGGLVVTLELLCLWSVRASLRPLLTAAMPSRGTR